MQCRLWGFQKQGGVSALFFSNLLDIVIPFAKGPLEWARDDMVLPTLLRLLLFSFVVFSAWCWDGDLSSAACLRAAEKRDYVMCMIGGSIIVSKDESDDICLVLHFFFLF